MELSAVDRSLYSQSAMGPWHAVLHDESLPPLAGGGMSCRSEELIRSAPSSASLGESRRLMVRSDLITQDLHLITLVHLIRTSRCRTSTCPTTLLHPRTPTLRFQITITVLFHRPQHLLKAVHSGLQALMTAAPLPVDVSSTFAFAVYLVPAVRRGCRLQDMSQPRVWPSPASRQLTAAQTSFQRPSRPH